MGFLDFPRVMFEGNVIVDPATANNNHLYPLCLYDPVQIRAFMPPRIYIDHPKIDKETDEYIKEQGFEIIEEADRTFLEIASIQNEKDFLTWAVTPLGSSELDGDYHILYTYIKSKKEGESIYGQTPGYWNYYGSMIFVFGGVKIHSVEYFEENTYQSHHLSEEPHEDEAIDQLLGASINLSDPKGASSAVMVDLHPDNPFYTQVFCDNICIQKEDHFLLNGKPKKASLRFLNPRQIINQKPPLASSGTFFSVIPLEDIEADSPLMDFFKAHALEDSQPDGLGISYHLSEVNQNLRPDYEKLGTRSNPCFGKVSGAISPWYKDEMISLPQGRLLTPTGEQLPDYRFPSAILGFNEKSSILSMDLRHLLPKVTLHKQKKRNRVYEGIMNMELVLVMRNEKGESMPLEEFAIKKGGQQKEEFRDYQLPPALLETLNTTGTLEIWAEQKKKRPIQVLRESPYLIASDQVGNYGHQGVEAFKSNSLEVEPIRIRMFEYGKAVQDPIKIDILKSSYLSPGYSKEETISTETEMADGFEFTPQIEHSEIATYLFVQPQAPYSYFQAHMMAQFSFVSTRVFPSEEIPDSEPISFETLYEKVLRLYQLVYPKSAIITPFTEENFLTILDSLKQISSEESWLSMAYMPTSREMTQAQRTILHNWIDHQLDSIKSA